LKTEVTMPSLVELPRELVLNVAGNLELQDLASLLQIMDDLVYFLTQSHASLRDNEGNTLLHIAAVQGRDQWVEFLLTKGFDISARNGQRPSKIPIDLAAKKGHEAVVRQLLQAGRGLNPLVYGDALRYATAGGHATIVQLFTEFMLPFQYREAVCVAAIGGHEAVLQVLINADGQRQNQRGYNDALLFSVGAGYKSAGRALGRNRSISIESPVIKTKLLSFAAPGRENKAITQLLLDAGAEISMSTRTGETALHWAAGSRSCSTVFQLLINAGANISARNSYGETPLHWASAVGYTPGVSMLINAGVSVSEQDGGKSTALHHAAKNGSAPIARLLIDAGIDVAKRNQRGETALQLAALGMHDAVVKELMAAYRASGDLVTGRYRPDKRKTEVRKKL
jgi:ankyrin repeat protein